jgi:hypothetical protein
MWDLYFSYWEIPRHFFSFLLRLSPLWKMSIGSTSEYVIYICIETLNLCITLNFLISCKSQFVGTSFKIFVSLSSREIWYHCLWP